MEQDRVPQAMQHEEIQERIREEEKMTLQSIAIDNLASSDKAILDWFVKRLDRLLWKGTVFENNHAVRDIVEYVYNRIEQFNVNVELGLTANHKDFWVDIECGQDDDPHGYHHSSFSLRQILYILKQISNGSIRHPCPRCQ